MRTADIVAEALLDWKVDVIFGLPGDGINGFIESLRRRQDRIKFILVRHEESASFMTCAYAKYTGKLRLDGSKWDSLEILNLVSNLLPLIG
jgi:pyruvate dehydrogenase (quinone)